MRTNKGLVVHARMALLEKWGYVFGTFGNVLTKTGYENQLEQYPKNVAQFSDFIKKNWIGKRTSDCVGLIKSYMWWDGKNAVRNPATDVNANTMHDTAWFKGTLDKMPEIEGLCVHKEGHIGIYIGGGQVIEAHGTESGVIQTPLKGKNATPWTSWLMCPYVTYEGILTRKSTGQDVLALQQSLNKIGYKLVADGIFGTGTETAVKNLQSNMSLPSTGIVDAATLNAIYVMVNKLSSAVSLTYDKIIDKIASSPTEWKEAIVDIVAEAKAGAVPPILQHLPTLIEKIYNRKV